MWNFNYTFPTVCLLIIFYLFYLLRPRLPLRSKQTFVWILLMEVLTMAADVFSSLMDENYEKYPLWALYTANILYFICFYLRIYLLFRFVMNILNLRFEDGPRRGVLLIGVNIVAILIDVSSFFTDAVFGIDAQGYHKGPLYNVLYVHAFFYLISCLIALFMYKNRLSRLHRYSAYGFVAILFVAMCIRLLMPTYLIMDMFCLLVIVIIYLAFENPEFYLDPGTELFNRSSLDLMVEEINGEQEYRIITFVIKDYQVNRDIYGWQQMDRGLAVIAEFLRELFRKDVIFYVRSGRFAIITQRQDVGEMCDTIHARFEKPWHAKSAELFLSVGLAIYDSSMGVRETENIISSLRYALNQAARLDQKEDIYINRQTIDTVERQFRVRKALERALEEKTTEVYLQPVVDATDFRVVGAEALARINDPDLGFVSPDEFIPIAETNGSIGRLGKQVLEKTCRFIKENNDRLGLEWVNVNLSPIQCMNKNLPEEFREILREYNIPNGKVHLEITEQAIIDSGVLKTQMQTMIKDGFQFALDDYGTGYSNALGVVSYPLSNIKIDRGIIWSHFENPNSFLPKEIAVFLDMHFSVTAEGVETKEMAERLRDFGCSFLQGYYFSKPIPMDVFVQKYGNS